MGGQLGGTGGALGGTGGGTGGSGPVGCTQCQPGLKGEPACCFEHPDGSVGCGLRVPEYGNHCLPSPAPPGKPDLACKNHSSGLTGCCLPVGVCGYLDDSHGLSCITTEALDVTPPPPCGGGPCGKLCELAIGAGCSAYNAIAPFPYYDCAARCSLRSCHEEFTALYSTCDSVIGCDTTGAPIAPGCHQENLDLALCRQTADCGQYCALVTQACPAQYKSIAECSAVCSAFEAAQYIGTGMSLGYETHGGLGCRMKALVEIDTLGTSRCLKAGPAGSTTVGYAPDACGLGLCSVYCGLLVEECPSHYGTLSACLDACGLIDTVPFTRDVVSGPSAACRFNQLLELVANPATTASCDTAGPSSTVCQ